MSLDPGFGQILTTVSATTTVPTMLLTMTAVLKVDNDYISHVRVKHRVALHFLLSLPFVLYSLYIPVLGTLWNDVYHDCDYEDHVDCGDRPLPGSTRPSTVSPTSTTTSSSSTTMSTSAETTATTESTVRYFISHNKS